MFFNEIVSGKNKKSDATLLLFQHNCLAFRGFLKERKYHLSKTYSYRILNHWTTAGIIDDTRNDRRGWKKFNIVELVWIEIISELRSFGFSISKIEKVKSDIQEEASSSRNISESLILQYFIGLALCRQTAFLLVYSNGNANLFIENEYRRHDSIEIVDNHIRISFDDVVHRVLHNKLKLSSNNESSNIDWAKKLMKELGLEIKGNLDRPSNSIYI